ncbi:MAG: protoporphyrinogen oxidase [Bacteroidota bacterium]
MIAVVGGGITGMVAAAALKRVGQEVELYDAADRVGGNIHSQSFGPYRLELGPNSLVLNDDLYAFFEDWGMTDSMVEALPTAKYRYILRDGKYQKLPTGPASLITSRTISWRAKRNLLKERSIPASNDPSETIDAFFRRRLGDEWTDYAVYPFISGVFAGNPADLLVAEAFPRIKKLENEYGSLIKGMGASRKNQTHRGTISLEGGVGKMIDILEKGLEGHIHTGHRIQRLEMTAEGVRLDFGQMKVHAQKVILALPAYVLASLLSDAYPAMASSLKAIHYPSVSMAFSAYKRADVGHPLDGFGVLHNHLEGAYTLGTIFNSSVFEGRCPKDEVLLTTFVGGAKYSDRADEPEEVLKAHVHEELVQFLSVKGKPTFQHVQRWPKAIPQYTKDILPSREEIQKLPSQIRLGGNWIGGISVPDSIQSGLRLAKEISGE